MKDMKREVLSLSKENVNKIVLQRSVLISYLS